MNKDCSVVKLDESTVCFLPHKNQPFDLIGKFIPIYNGEKWSYSEILYDKNAEKQTKTYKDEIFEPKDFIDNEKREMFLAICDNICIGHITVSTGWLGKGHIDDLSVDSAYRRFGTGKKLMDSAVAWCRERQISGVSLETQNVNLQACRFYLKYGFELCGVNTKKYALSKYDNEIALFFYLKL